MSPSDELALRRTEWALERTQLAWVRTAFALIAAGLGLDRGMLALQESRLLTNQLWTESAHWGGIAITLGAGLQLAFATWIYIRRQRELCRTYAPNASSWPVAVPLSIVVTLLGLGVAVVLSISG